MTDPALRDLLAGVYDADDWYDPGPRLVLADYLDEVGHPAARLVRAEARAGGCDADARVALRRSFDLPRHSSWDCGLPRIVLLPFAQLGKVSDEFRRAAVQGWYGTLTLTGFNHRRANALRKATWLADVPRLGIILDYRADVPDAVAVLPPWSNLTGFSASGNRTTTDEAARVLGGRPSLRTLSLSGGPLLTDAAVGHLAGLPDLRVLDLARTRLTRFVTEPPAFPRLARLVLTQSDQCAEVRVRGLQHLQEIEFPHDVIDVALDDLPALRRVDLLCAGELRGFRAAGVPRLALLVLRMCGELRELTAEGLEHPASMDLTGCPNLPAEAIEAVRRANPTALVESDGRDESGGPEKIRE